MQELPSILLRLEQLELQNRRLKRIGSAATLGLVALLAMAATSASTSSADKLTGSSLELTTPDGEVYASLSLDPKGYPLFHLKKGESYALMTMQGPAIHMRAENIQRTAFLGMDTRGTSRLELTNDAIQGGARVVVKEDGTSGFYGLDKSGYDRISMESISNGHAAFTLFSDKRLVRGTFSLDSKGNASQLLLDPNGRRRAGMLVEEDGTPTISLVDDQSRPRLNMSMEFDGHAKVEFLREDGAVGKRLP